VDVVSAQWIGAEAGGKGASNGRLIFLFLYIDTYQFKENKTMNCSKVHISLDVNDLEKSVNFYSTLFQTAPTKVKPGYAKFDLDEPSINLTLGESNVDRVNGPNHMGVRVSTIDEVIAAKLRLESAGFVTSDEMGVTCCYAVQDKIWATDPTGYRWEVYIFKGDSEQFGPAKLVAGEKCDSPCCR
jgi:predicted enzyme related to lactoylglutathione lyase